MCRFFGSTQLNRNRFRRTVINAKVNFKVYNNVRDGLKTRLIATVRTIIIKRRLFTAFLQSRTHKTGPRFRGGQERCKTGAISVVSAGSLWRPILPRLFLSRDGRTRARHRDWGDYYNTFIIILPCRPANKSRIPNWSAKRDDYVYSLIIIIIIIINIVITVSVVYNEMPRRRRGLR